MDTIGKKSGLKKYVFGIILLLLLIGTGFFFFQYYYVIATGVKNGQLNYFTYKGYVFKTYEGRLIQAGIRPGASGQGVQSNDFEFSVTDKEIAKRLAPLSGYELQLHYKEYNRAIPWRGYSKYVVDSIVSVKESSLLQYAPM